MDSSFIYDGRTAGSMLSQATFDTEWELWCGLFPHGTRKKSAYYVMLKHLSDTQFKAASRAAAKAVRNFPNVDDILSRVEAKSSYVRPERPLENETPEELKAYHESLEDYFDLATAGSDKHGLPPKADGLVSMKHIAHRVLGRLVALNAAYAAKEYHRKMKTKRPTDERG